MAFKKLDVKKAVLEGKYPFFKILEYGTIWKDLNYIKENPRLEDRKIGVFHSGCTYGNITEPGVGYGGEVIFYNNADGGGYYCSCGMSAEIVKLQKTNDLSPFLTRPLLKEQDLEIYTLVSATNGVVRYTKTELLPDSQQRAYWFKYLQEQRKNNFK